MNYAITAVVVAFVALAGCATSSPVALPGGGQGFAIKCPDPKKCYNKAAEVCAPGVYELAATNSSGAGAVYGGTGGFGTETTLIIRCVAK